MKLESLPQPSANSPAMNTLVSKIFRLDWLKREGDGVKWEVFEIKIQMRQAEEKHRK
jgi:hypothetical protein